MTEEPRGVEGELTRWMKERKIMRKGVLAGVAVVLATIAGAWTVGLE